MRPAAGGGRKASARVAQSQEKSERGWAHLPPTIRGERPPGGTRRARCRPLGRRRGAASCASTRRGTRVAVRGPRRRRRRASPRWAGRGRGRGRRPLGEGTPGWAVGVPRGTPAWVAEQHGEKEAAAGERETEDAAPSFPSSSSSSLSRSSGSAPQRACYRPQPSMLHLGSYCTQLDHAVKHHDGPQLAHLVALDGKHAHQLLDWLARPDRGPARADRTLDQVRQLSPLSLELRRLLLDSLDLTSLSTSSQPNSPRPATPPSSGAPCPRTGPGPTSPPTTSGPSSPSTCVPLSSPPRPPPPAVDPLSVRAASHQPLDGPAPRPSRRRLCLPEAARGRHVRLAARSSSSLTSFPLAGADSPALVRPQRPVPMAHRRARPPDGLGPATPLRRVP